VRVRSTGVRVTQDCSLRPVTVGDERDPLVSSVVRQTTRRLPAVGDWQTGDKGRERGTTGSTGQHPMALSASRRPPSVPHGDDLVKICASGERQNQWVPRKQRRANASMSAMILASPYCVLCIV